MIRIIPLFQEITRQSSITQPLSPYLKSMSSSIVTTVIHACQDPVKRVRYYSAESLFNVLNTMPYSVKGNVLQVFEVMSLLICDVDPIVRDAARMVGDRIRQIIVKEIEDERFDPGDLIDFFLKLSESRNQVKI